MAKMRVTLVFSAVLGLSLLRSVILRRGHPYWQQQSGSSSSSYQLREKDWDSTHTNTYTDNDRHMFARLSGPSPVELFAISAVELNRQPELAAWQNTEKPLCSREQIRKGSWVRTMLEEAPYVTQTTHLRCYPKEYYKQKPFPSWRWQPEDADCDFSKFRHEMMCRLLAHATVMIVGDSLSWEHYSSLVQLVGHPIHQGFQHQSLEFRSNIVQHLNCGSADSIVRLVYRRDDKLEDLRFAIDQDFPTVLVLNRGAHFTNDTDLLRNMQQNLDILHKYWWRVCEHHGLQCHLFWRTSVPGHPHCDKFTHPVNNRTDMEAWVGMRSNYDNHTIKYHWYDYQRQNLLVEEFWMEKANFPVTILDAYDLNILRPDEHRAHQGDCLHNCYPGKMDVYSQLMLHYLRMDRTVQGVQNQRLVAPDLVKSSNEPTLYDKAGWMKARKEREARKHKKSTSSS